MTKKTGGGTSLPLIAFLITLLVCLACGTVLAAEGGGHDASHDNERLWDLAYRFLNFTLLVIILFIVIRKTAVKDFFSSRRNEIRQKLDALKKEREDAETRHRELEKKLKEFETQKTDIIAQYEAEGALEKEKIIKEAEERAEQILLQADLTIQREMEAAKGRLKQQVVEAAANKAQELIEKEIKQNDHDQLIDEFIERVEKLH